MFFQQWTGINAILYYAPTIFQDLGLTGSTTSLLATGVVGIVYVMICLSYLYLRLQLFLCSMFIATIPAVIWIDDWGRKPVL